MSKRSKLLLIKLNKSLTGILILLLLFLQLNAGLTTGMAVDIHENAFTSSKSLLLENGDIFSHPTLADESNPSIARLINREENEFFEQGLRIPENKNTVASNTSFSGNSDTPENLAINIDLEKPFYVPGETVHFLIQLTGNLNGDFVPISGESVSVQIYHGWEESIAFLSGLTDNEGLWEAAYDPPKEGTYMLEVSVEGSYRKRWAEFTVSSLGLFWRHPWEFMPGQEIRAYAMVLNTSTLTPIENAQLDLSIRQHDNEWTEVYSGISDSNGICDIRYIIDTGSSYSYEANISAHFNDKSVSIVQWLYQYWDYSYYQDDDRSSGEFDIITTTDKPLYKPGEQIYFRSLVWEQNHLTVSKKPVQVPIELTFVSPSGYTLLRKNLQTSSNGIASDSIKLDESAELGNYSIIAKVDSSSSTTIVKVDRYERPDFRVSATISPDYSDSKINLVGKIRAEYYFGQPVVEGQVEVDIILDGDLLQSKSGKLSKKGEWTFHLSISQSDTNYVIDVKVTDSVGRSVESKTDLPGRSAIEIYSYVSPKLALPEDEIYCSVWAYDRSSSDYYWGHPITDGTAHFEIYGIISILFGTKSIKLKEFNSDLNDWGYASASWTLSEEEIASFTSFRVKIQIETADGREGSAEEYYSYSRKTVKINIPEAVYQPGNAVTISVTVKDRFLNKDTWVNGRLYVFDLDWDAIGYIDKTFSGTSSITFRLSPYARSGQYLVGLQIREEIELDEFVWRHYQYVKATFQVGPEASIILSTTKESFVAGENIEIQGSHSFETSAPLILETVKRGIVELYVLEPKSSFSIQIENSMLLAPNFAVNAYLID
ncbi:MAG: MG2 domain-containing protein, partial [Candidatus Hodarchaeota archaeon]